MLAAVQGQCLGGGLELASFCHWIFSSPGAHYGQPEVNLGVFPPIASLILPWRVGQTRADDLILTGKSITAVEAMTIGLVHEVSEDPLGTALTYMEQHILSKSAAALKHTVQAARWQMYRTLREEIPKLEEMYVNKLMETEDANEGIQSFIEKRPPVWKNK